MKTDYNLSGMGLCVYLILDMICLSGIISISGIILPVAVKWYLFLKPSHHATISPWIQYAAQLTKRSSWKMYPSRNFTMQQDKEALLHLISMKPYRKDLWLELIVNLSL